MIISGINYDKLKIIMSKSLLLVVNSTVKIEDHKWQCNMCKAIYEKMIPLNDVMCQWATTASVWGPQDAYASPKALSS